MVKDLTNSLTYVTKVLHSLLDNIMENENEVKDIAPFENGTEVSWTNLNSVDKIGTIVSYLGEGLMLVRDVETDIEHEIMADWLTEV